VSCIACLVMTGLCPAAGLPLQAASGTVIASKDSKVIIRPRNASGEFGTALVLNVRGTTHITSLSTRKQAGKIVLVQNDADPRQVRKNQVIAVVYTTTGEGNVLLSAVVTASTGDR